MRISFGRNRQLNDLPQFLLELLPLFAESEELALLDEELRRMPGLMCGALTAFLGRLQDREMRHEASGEEILELDRCYAALEWMATSRDYAVVNLLVTEVFENLPDPPRVAGKIVEKLQPASRTLYAKGIEQ